jgi:ferredoxin--NADP+ reductase
MNDLSHDARALAPAPRDGFGAPFTVERVLALRHPAPGLARFDVTRPAGFRFTPGHYARLGLGPDDAVVWRPYSIASPAHDAGRLEFHFTRVPGGAFNAHFDPLGPGDAIRLDRRSFGFLTLAQVRPGGTLWLVATGTGIAPFLSILADPSTWTRHERVVVAHSVRAGAELAHEQALAAAAQHHGAGSRLRFVPVVTRESWPGALTERVGALLAAGALEEAAGARLDAAGGRLLLCGNPEMIREMRALARSRGLEPGRRGVPGTLATEGYW